MMAFGLMVLWWLFGFAAGVGFMSGILFALKLKDDMKEVDKMFEKDIF